MRLRRRSYRGWGRTSRFWLNGYIEDVGYRHVHLISLHAADSRSRYTSVREYLHWGLDLGTHNRPIAGILKAFIAACEQARVAQIIAYLPS